MIFSEHLITEDELREFAQLHYGKYVMTYRLSYPLQQLAQAHGVYFMTSNEDETYSGHTLINFVKRDSTRFSVTKDTFGKIFDIILSYCSHKHNRITITGSRDKWAFLPVAQFESEDSEANFFLEDILIMLTISTLNNTVMNITGHMHHAERNQMLACMKQHPHFRKWLVQTELPP